MKIFFSCALAFVLSLMCLPNLTPLFDNSSSPSTVTAEGYQWNYGDSFDVGISAYPGVYKASDGSYHITDYTGLQALADYSVVAPLTIEEWPDCMFYLDNDIDCSGQEFTGIAVFNGTIDGQGYSILNLKCIPGSNWYGYPCFLGCPLSVTLKNIKFLNFQINGDSEQGALVYGDSTPRFEKKLSLINIYLDSHNFSYYYGGFVYQASDTDLLIQGCSLIEENTDEYGVAAENPELSYGAFVATFTDDSNIIVQDSYCIGGHATLFCGDSSYRYENSLSLNGVYLWGYVEKPKQGTSGKAGEDERRYMWSGNGFSQQVYDESAQPIGTAIWNQYDNINDGLPYIAAAVISGSGIIFNGWLNTNPSFNIFSSMPSTLSACGFQEVSPEIA